MLLWMSLIGGAAGAMYWQYRPEYLSFESPGYSLTAPDGAPTARLKSACRAIAQIDRLKDDFPLVIPQAEIGIVYHSESQELFGLNNEGGRFLSDLHDLYRAFWAHGVPVDVISPRMDCSDYKLLFLQNVALMDSVALEQSSVCLIIIPICIWWQRAASACIRPTVRQAITHRRDLPTSWAYAWPIFPL